MGMGIYRNALRPGLASKALLMPVRGGFYYVENPPGNNLHLSALLETCTRASVSL